VAGADGGVGEHIIAAYFHPIGAGNNFAGRLAAGGPAEYRYARTPGSPTMEERP
jgi:hypothetical protein